MSFLQIVQQFNAESFARKIGEVSDGQIERVLGRENVSPEDFALLLSPGAEKYLEKMAWQAQQLTQQHFGKTILLYTPLYLANYCVNGCLYCGFSANHQIPRMKLTLSQLKEEAEIIAHNGLKHILILSGESRAHTPPEYIKDCLKALRQYFSSIAIEIYPLQEEEYRELSIHGVDGLTIYQEVYQQDVYKHLHPFGPKQDYGFRLEAPERAARAGMRSINIGCLLGLYDWRQEAYLLGLHALYLQEKFPGVELSISLPRLRPEVGGFIPADEVNDKNLVQMILAMRLFIPRLGITISTREKPSLRDNLLKLGVTKMSAGSSTKVGARIGGSNHSTVGQFEIADHRTVAEMAAMIYQAGYQPIYQDWQVI